jgi:hypothetical protein
MIAGPSTARADLPVRGNWRWTMEDAISERSGRMSPLLAGPGFCVNCPTCGATLTYVRTDDQTHVYRRETRKIEISRVKPRSDACSQGWSELHLFWRPQPAALLTFSVSGVVLAR